MLPLLQLLAPIFLLAQIVSGKYVTSNNGTSWSQVNNGLTDLIVNTMVADGSNLYAGTFDQGLFVSSNNGSSWTSVTLPRTNYPVICLESANGKLGVIIEDGGLFLSNDNGVSWCQGLDNDFFFQGIGALHFFNGIMLAGTQGGLYYSSSSSQTITFNAIQDLTLGAPSPLLSASSTSGLPISFQTNSTNITVNGNTLTINGPGRDTLTAIQPGNGCYLAATPVSQIFCVNPSQPIISSSLVSSNSIALSSSASDGNQWFLNKTLLGANDQILTISIPGIYAVQVTVNGCQSSISDNFSIANQTITFGPLPTLYVGLPNFTISCFFNFRLTCLFSSEFTQSFNKWQYLNL